MIPESSSIWIVVLLKSNITVCSLWGPTEDISFPFTNNLTTPVSQQFPNLRDAVPCPYNDTLIVPIASPSVHPNHEPLAHDPICD